MLALLPGRVTLAAPVPPPNDAVRARHELSAAFHALSADVERLGGLFGVSESSLEARALAALHAREAGDERRAAEARDRAAAEAAAAAPKKRKKMKRDAAVVPEVVAEAPPPAGVVAALRAASFEARSAAAAARADALDDLDGRLADAGTTPKSPGRRASTSAAVARLAIPSLRLAAAGAGNFSPPRLREMRLCAA